MSKYAKTENKETNKNYTEITSFMVKNPKIYDWGITYNLELNGVMIYGCRLIETKRDGKDVEFVGFPARKGNDDKYYNYAYAYLSPEKTEEICGEVIRQLREDNQI